MKSITTALVSLFFITTQCFTQTNSTQQPRGFAQYGAVTGFALLNSNFYAAIYDSGMFPISGSSLSGQIPGSDNVIISLTSSGTELIVGIDALSGDSAQNNGTDGGVWEYNGSWSKIGNPSNSAGGLPSHSVTAVAWDGTYAFAGLPGSDLKSESPSFGGVWRAKPPNKWDSCFAGPMTDSSFVKALFENDSTLYAGAFSSDVPISGSRGLGNGGIFTSTDHGTTWNDISFDLPNRDITCITRVDTILYVGTLYKGVFRKSLGANSWTHVPFPDSTNPVSCFAVDGANLFAGTFCIDSLHYSHGVFCLENNGSNWIAVSVPGLKDSTIVSALGVYNGNLYVGTGGTFGMPSQYYGLLSVPAAIDGVRSTDEMPSKFTLEQNYPNPFNPSTVINYQLPANCFVTLKVYDVIGRNVATLISERQNAGEHSAIFNGVGLPSGVYLYRLTAGNLSQTRKLMLIK